MSDSDIVGDKRQLHKVHKIRCTECNSNKFEAFTVEVDGKPTGDMTLVCSNCNESRSKHFKERLEIG